VHYTRAEHATISSLGEYSVYQPFHGDPGLRGDMFANVMMLVMLRPVISELSKVHKSHDMPWMLDTELPW